jgi:putative phosphoesterase
VALRIAVIADTHMPRGERSLPPSCVEAIAGSELLLHAGDFAAEQVLEKLERIGPPLRGVHGNVDSPELQRRLPAELSLQLEGVALAMVHDAGPATGRLERLRKRFPAADAVVFGHSHLPLHERAGGFQIFNPGSPTERRRAPAHTMGIAELAGGEIRFRHLKL